MKTPEEIKKGLECCLGDEWEYHCDECPYRDCDECCKHDGTLLYEDALAYIRQLEEELKAYRWYEGETERQEGD